jgi:hypothetical protein
MRAVTDGTPADRVASASHPEVAAHAVCQLEHQQPS